MLRDKPTHGHGWALLLLPIGVGLGEGLAHEPGHAHPRERPLPLVRLLRDLAEVHEYRRRRTQCRRLDREPLRAENAGLPRNHVGPTRCRVYHRDTIGTEKFQQRLVRVEAIEGAKIRLVRVAEFVLILIGGNVPRAGEAGHREGVDEPRRHVLRSDGANVDQLRAFLLPDIKHQPILNHDHTVADHSLRACRVNEVGDHREHALAFLAAAVEGAHRSIGLIANDFLNHSWECDPFAGR